MLRTATSPPLPPPPPHSWVGGGPGGALGVVTPSGAGCGAEAGPFAAHTPRTKRILGGPKVWSHPGARLFVQRLGGAHPGGPRAQFQPSTHNGVTRRAFSAVPSLFPQPNNHAPILRRLLWLSSAVNSPHQPRRVLPVCSKKHAPGLAHELNAPVRRWYFRTTWNKYQCRSLQNC